MPATLPCWLTRRCLALKKVMYSLKYPIICISKRSKQTPPPPYIENRVQNWASMPWLPQSIHSTEFIDCRRGSEFLRRNSMMALSETDFLQRHTRSEDSYRSGIFKRGRGSKKGVGRLDLEEQPQFHPEGSLEHKLNCRVFPPQGKAAREMASVFYIHRHWLKPTLESSCILPDILVLYTCRKSGSISWKGSF